MVEVYSREFLTHLISQAVDKKDRYKPVSHKSITVGDIVLLVELNTKRSNYPMGIVEKVNINQLGEATSAIVLKGHTREKVFRHSSSLIPLLQVGNDCETHDVSTEATESSPREESCDRRRSKREATITAREKISDLYSEDLV